jgi:NAD(P)-dependent dehydrogenase (short-subunit alcohol dehydrogenase family)
MLNRFTISADRKAGYLATLPTKRAATPEDIAETIMFLASGKAPFLTGQSIVVDGGKTAA